MNQQAARIFEKADAELNRVYKQLIDTLEKLSDKKRVTLLRDNQRAWLKYRDTLAQYDAYEMYGGSAYPLLYSGSMASTTKLRTQELKESLKQLKELKG
jgi:uncharacterized protein YecT (DUF1311 family)